MWGEIQTLRATEQLPSFHLRHLKSLKNTVKETILAVTATYHQPASSLWAKKQNILHKAEVALSSSTKPILPQALYKLKIRLSWFTVGASVF